MATARPMPPEPMTPEPAPDEAPAPPSPVRHGFGAVRPYLHGPLSLIDFVAEVFGAQELERHEFGPDSVHVEMQVADSVLVIEAGTLPPDVAPWLGSVYVYVPDVDAVFARAVAAGARTIAAPADKPYAERQGGFTDAAGNTWWVATCLHR